MKNLREQAQELINCGNSREKAEGYGMMKVIEIAEKLQERLNASQSAMDNCLERMAEQGLNLEETDFYLELAGELAPNEELLKSIEDNTEKYARKCDVTGEGMNKGFVYRDGEKYFKHEKDLIAHIRSLGDEQFNDASDEFILNESFKLEEHYYTEWEDEEDFQYEMIDGVLTEIE